jgi:hypothetical protein
MYKIILSAVLTLATVSAWAEWTPAGESEEVNEYVDLTSIKRSGNFVKLLSLCKCTNAQKTKKYQYILHNHPYLYYV